MLKMKLSGFLAFTLLSISILSFGLTGAVNAQENLPLSVNTDASAYTTGNSITVSGNVKTLGENPTDVIIIVSNPIGNFVKVSQISPDDLGNYSMTFKSGGPYMTSSGEYKIEVSYGAQKMTGTFDFISANAQPTQEPTPEPTPETDTRMWYWFVIPGLLGMIFLLLYKRMHKNAKNVVSN